MVVNQWAQQAKWVLAAGLLIAILAYYVVWNQQQRLWQKQLEQEVFEDTLFLSGKLEINERELLGIVSLYNASDFVNREEFKTYVGPILRNSSFILGVEWIPKVPLGERPDYEKRMRLRGYADFRFIERSEDGSMLEAKIRDEYFPVYYVEPYKGNEGALGFDFASAPALLKTIREARDNGRPTATEKIDIVRGKQIKADMLIFAPIYETGKIPQTLVERRKRLKGLILGVYRIQDMMSEMVQPFLSKGVNLVVFDNDVIESNNKLFGDLIPQAPLETKTVINISGRRWILVWQASEEFMGGPNTVYAVWVSGGIFGVAILLAIIFEMMVSRTRQVENQVRVRTGELTTANEKLTNEISTRRKIQEELHVAKEEAELANRAKSTFLANMSHEIRTPMNAILGYAQILRGQKRLDLSQHKNIENILTSGDHLLRLINDILDLSKIEAGKMELRESDFDLNELIRGISSMMKPRCEEENLEWRVQGVSPEPIFVHGDEIKLKQILINLIGNSVKFTDAGQVTLRLERMGDDRYQFHVIDTGKGIPKDFQSRMFDPFQQEAEGVKKGGAGLGLAIVKKQVELMGGHLGLDSEKGEETRFFFTVRLPDAQDAVVSNSGFLTKRMRLADGCRVTALVVDDVLLNRDVLSNILEDTGLEVLTAENGQEAVEKVRAHSPDIVFMDLRMPVMDGIQAIRQIRKEGIGETMRTVAITASAFEHQREMTLKEGFDEFISKPFPVERIFKSLVDLLGVQLEDQDGNGAAPSPEEEAPINFSNLLLPEELIGRLKKAAELHNITDLRNYLEELESLGEQGRRLLEHLKPCVLQYNMDGVMDILRKIGDD